MPAMRRLSALAALLLACLALGPDGAGAFAPAPHKPSRRGEPGMVRHLAWQDEIQGFPAHIYGTLFTPDGKHYIGYGDSGPLGGIRMWEVATGKQVREFFPGKQTWWGTAALSPNGKYLAGNYARNNEVFVWDVASGKLLCCFNGPSGPGNGIDVARDNRRVLSGCTDRTVRVWDIATRKLLLKLEGHEGPAWGRFSLRGTHVLTVSGRVLRLWGAERGELLHKLEGHTASCNGTFSPDGRRVLSWGDRTVRLWDVKTGKLLRTFEGHPTATGAALRWGGRQVVSWGTDRALRFWDADTGKEGRKIDLGGDHTGLVVLTPDGRLAITYHHDQTLRVRDLVSGRELHRYGGLRAGSGFSVSPGGDYCACGSFRAGVSLFCLPAPP